MAARQSFMFFAFNNWKKSSRALRLAFKYVYVSKRPTALKYTRL